MRYLKILADDLTGAADSAARCRRFGLPATIFLDIPKLPLPTGALAFTSDSRHLTAEAAGQRVHNMGASLPDVEGRWYKKIDSTLRGNIGSELDALLDLLDAPAAVVCPSFPGQGRVLRNGILTAPELGPPAVHLPSLLRKQSRHPVAALSLEQVRGGELAAKMKHLMQGRDSFTGKQRTVIAVDALTDDDLDRVVGAQQEGLPAALLCGSAGLVGALARRVGIEKGSSDVCASPRAHLFCADARRKTATACGRDARDPRAGRLRSAGQSVLAVVGSGSDVSHRQIDFLLRSTGEASQPAVSRLIVLPETEAAATATLDPEQPIWLLQQPRPHPGTVLEGAEARQRADHLARVSVAALARRPVDLLLLVGGDTAMPILRQLDAARLSVERELLPGMPLCSAVIDGRQTLVVLKPGHFGEEGTLVALLDRVGLFGHGA